MATTQQTTTISRPRDYLRLTKPGIVISNVMTAAAGLWLAPEAVSMQTAVAALVGTGLLVAGSGAFNQVLERDTDAFMKRTSTRPLPAGRLEPYEGVLLGILSITAGMLLLGVCVNAVSAVLGLLATVIYAFVYTPLKRRTFWAVPLGGIAGALPPAMGWTAATGHLGVGAVAFFSVMFWWQMPHFLGIALFRASDYRNAGLKIAPSPAGYRRTVLLMRLSAVCTLVSVVALPFLAQVGWPFMVAALLGTVGPMTNVVRKVDYADVSTWGRRVFLSSLATLPLFAVGALLHQLIG